MKKEHFICELPNGVHARPANVIKDLADEFLCEITWTNERTNAHGDAKSVLSIISTGTVLTTLSSFCLTAWTKRMPVSDSRSLFTRNLSTATRL